jgi:DNA-binding MarR family transcriptional regulator
MQEKVNSVDLSDLDEALALLHFGFRAVVQEPDRILAKRGLARVHHRVLFFVAKNPGCRVGELLGISKQALHGPMRDLMRRGLLESAVDPTHRRAHLLQLTRRGLALEDKLSGIQRDLFAQAFAAAGVRARQGFRAVLKQLGGGRSALLVRDTRRPARTRRTTAAAA